MDKGRFYRLLVQDKGEVVVGERSFSNDLVRNDADYLDRNS